MEKIIGIFQKAAEKQKTSIQVSVSEGSTVVLDVYDLVKDIDISSIKYYLWEQTAGISIANEDVKNKPTFSFTALYVKDSDFDLTNPSLDHIPDNVSIMTQEAFVELAI